MAHSLPTTTASAIPISSKPASTSTLNAPSSLPFQKTSNTGSHSNTFLRRTVTLGIAGALLGLNAGGGQNANAGKRPPPAAPKEKIDPNVSGVQAKVLASKKRKEALKESVAKLREKGTPIITH